MASYPKNMLMCFIMLLFSLLIYGQPNINKIEYYIDTDPGYGNAISINLTPASNFSSITTNVNTATLKTGVHLLGLRAKDSNGSWSIDNKWLFVKDSSVAISPNIINAEYYIDNDPGFGKAIPLNITSTTNLSSLTTNLNPIPLSTGVHIFGIRAKDANGAWSFDNKWVFVKDITPTALPNIVNAEFYIDIDPGYGKATAVSIVPGTGISNLPTNTNPTILTAGVHIFGIRAKDSNGAWSIDNKWLFVKDLPILTKSNIVRVEYYLNKDPGYGKGTSVQISPDTNLVNIVANLNTSTLADGTDTFVIRAEDATGAWSLDNKWIFKSQGNLPITLTNFTGAYHNNSNELTAIVATAVNVKAIELERSTNGVNFNFIGNMAVAPVIPGTYKYEDANPVSGINYYRLKTVDLDGHFDYSYIIQLNHTSIGAITAYPNPVVDNVTVHFENAGIGIYTIRITDILGKVLMTHKTQIAQGAQFGDVNLSLKFYIPSTYFIQVYNKENKTIMTQKILKIN